jgi:peroxiredoxin Q/BCP
MSLKVGDSAPDFELPDESGNIRTLEEFKGKKLVLFFYPKDNSLMCTRQACNLRDNYQKLQENEITILGVSYDSPESHKYFIAKNELPFSLLSDEEKAVAKAYGASGGLLGKFMANRYTYLIDEKGTIIKIFTDVDVTNQVDPIIEAYKESGKK